ncbi:MAG: DNA cytosine methyltransferase [Xanthobacteraceae bacterium]
MTSKQNSRTVGSPITAVDLFCGVGGLTHGLIRGGVKVVAGIDVDGSCRYPYEKNNSARFLERDIKVLSGSEIKELFAGAETTLLAGCAPCQPFSTYSRGRQKRGSESEWELVASFGRLVREVKPDLVTMENVPQVEHHPVFDQFLKNLDGYKVSWATVECSKLGIPQTRKRFVLVASRMGRNALSIPVDDCRKPVTVRKAISGLPILSAGEADARDPLHIACRLSDLNLKRIRASKPGGTWRDWKPSLRAACHRKSSGDTYPSVYGRMEWDKPAPTMTTQCFGYGNGRFGHPEQDRAITLREAAMLQTFPRSYVFVAPGERIRFSHMGRLIGNAVPVRLGEVIAGVFIRHVGSIGLA